MVLCKRHHEIVRLTNKGFASHHGPDFYGLPRNKNSVTLVREDWSVPETYAFGDTELVPLRAGATIGWTQEGSD